MKARFGLLSSSAYSGNQIKSAKDDLSLAFDVDMDVVLRQFRS